MSNDELILKHFKQPDGYSFGEDAWARELAFSLKCNGCDWLEEMQRFNPAPAEAVLQLCKHVEALENELAELAKAVNREP